MAGQLAREPHNAPLHLFSASAELINFGQGAYGPRSGRTSGVLQQLFNAYQGEVVMPFTWADFDLWYIEDHFPQLTPQEQGKVLQQLSPDRRRELLQSLPAQERRDLVQSLPAQERREVLESLPLEERLAGLSEEQIRQYLDQLTAGSPAQPRKPQRKK